MTVMTTQTNAPPVIQGRVQSSTYQTYNTRYKTNAPPSPQPTVNPGGGGIWDNSKRMIGNMVHHGQPTVNVPNGVPKILGNRSGIFYMWLTAMIVIGFDEWHNLGVLPRPSRLWSTSLVFGILAIVSSFDIMVPLTNALAFGFVMVLIYQYYNESGQFTNVGGGGGGGKVTPA